MTTISSNSPIEALRFLAPIIEKTQNPTNKTSQVAIHSLKEQTQNYCTKLNLLIPEAEITQLQGSTVDGLDKATIAVSLKTLLAKCEDKDFKNIQDLTTFKKCTSYHSQLMQELNPSVPSEIPQFLSAKPLSLKEKTTIEAIKTKQATNLATAKKEIIGKEAANFFKTTVPSILAPFSLGTIFTGIIVIIFATPIGVPILITGVIGMLTAVASDYIGRQLSTEIEKQEEKISLLEKDVQTINKILNDKISYLERQLLIKNIKDSDVRTAISKELS
jgi:hypothetical protein